jgi:PAS domain S-box-containing protein
MSSTYVRPLDRRDSTMTVLCVAPDETTLESLSAGLERADADVTVFEARTPADAFQVLDAEDVGCVVSALSLTGADGLRFLRQVRTKYDDLPFVLVAEAGSESVAADAINAGVDGYVPSDGELDEEAFETLVDRIATVVRDYRSHQRFEDATELLFRLTEFTSDALWMFTGDWSETVVMNSAYEDIWDRSQADVVEDPSDFLAGIHPEDRPLVREKMAALSGGQATDLEFRVETREDPDWVSVHAEPVVVDGEVEYVAGFTRDVTERREREQAIREANEQFETLVENLPVIVFTLDADGIFTTSAGAGLGEIGFEPGDLEGVSVYDAYADYGELTDAVDRALAGEEVRLTLEVEGTVFETWYRPVEDEHGEVVQVIGVSRDVTAMKRREGRIEQVNEATRELQHARSRREVGRVAIDIVDSVIECPVTAYWEYDAERDVLEPTAATDRALSVAGVEDPVELPTISDGHDEMAVFRGGEPRWVENYADLSNPSNPDADLGRLLLVPLGDHGMINIGHPDPGGFDDFDRYLVEILGQTAAAALDRVEREGTLRDRTEELETLLNNGPLVFYAFDPDGTIVESRGRGLRQLGLEPGEAVGGDIFEMYEDEPAITGAIETAISGDVTSETVEFGGQWLDNTFVPVVEDGDVDRVIGVAFDVTAQKTAEEQFAALSESAIALSDSDTGSDAVAEALAIVERVLGSHVAVYWSHDPEERRLVSSTVSDPADVLQRDGGDTLVHEEGDPVWRVFEGGETVLDNEFAPSDTASDSPLESMVFAPVGAHGMLTVGVRDPGAFDERDRHLVGTLAGLLRSTLDRLEHERDLEASRTELERSNESLQQFAYVASHDLQEPLRMVSSYVSLLEAEYGDAFDEEGEEYLHYAVDGAQRMQAMIDALLRYSRVQTQGEEFAEVDLDAVFAETVRSLEMLIDEEDATVAAGDLPGVHADRSQVAQLLQNLVKNAVDYGGPGATVTVEGHREDERVHLTVSDDGPGIDASQHDRIFEIFKSNEGGTGIGLAMCRRIAHRHDGDIWVESEPGDGATFHVTLPAVDGTDPTASTADTQARTETDGGTDHPAGGHHGDGGRE